MAEKYRIQALVNGAWKTRSVFSEQDDYTDVCRAADQLRAAGESSEVRILEAYKTDQSGKLAYRVSFSQKASAVDRLPEQSFPGKYALSGPEMYAIEKGLTGEWVEISEAQAKRHPLYGVKGWLFFLFFSLAVGLIRDLGTDNLWLAIVMSPVLVFQEPIAIVLFFFILLFYVVPLWLLTKKSYFFQPVTITIMLMLVFMNLLYIEGYGQLFSIGLNIMWIGYIAFSERVNVTTKNRVRPEYLKKVWEQDYPVPQSLISSSDL